MAQVFISYSQVDAMVAKEIAEALAPIGCWYYERDFLAGIPHLETTKREIELSSLFLVIVSPAAIKSDFVFPELLHAVATKKRLLPVLVGLTHKDLERDHPRWIVAFGFTATLCWGTDTCLVKIIEGCHYVAAASVEAPPLVASTRGAASSEGNEWREEVLHRVAWILDTLNGDGGWGGLWASINGGDVAHSLYPDLNRWSLTDLIRQGWDAKTASATEMQFRKCLLGVEERDAKTIDRAKAALAEACRVLEATA